MKVQWMMTMAAVAGLALAPGVLPVNAAQSSDSQSGKQSGQLSRSDYRFLASAARGGMEEVQLGQLAEQKAANTAVRDFGQRMVTDHNKANEELRQLASQKGAMLPTQLSHLENYRVEHLQKLSGPDFDRAYAKDMVKDHQKDVREFEKASRDLTDPDLKAWAQKTLTTLQQHLQLAQNLDAGAKAKIK